MVCASALTATQAGAFGDFMGGNGFASLAGPLAAATQAAAGPLGAALGGVEASLSVAVSSISTPLTEVLNATAAAVGSAAGGSVLASSIAGQVIASAQAAVGGNSDFLGKMVSQGLKVMPVDISSATQIFDQVSAFAGSSNAIMNSITTSLGTSFGPVIGGISNFTDIGFTGGAINNFGDLLTNGAAGLTDGLSASIGGLGEGFAKLGSFGDMADISNLMQPGQIVGQMLESGLGEIGDLGDKLLVGGIGFDQLGLPAYQDKIAGIMGTITNVTDLADIQQVMGSALNLSSLADVVDMSKVLDINIPTTFNSFSELATSMEGFSTGIAEGLGGYGSIISNMVDTADLSILNLETTLLNQVPFDNITSYFGGGTGPDGSILMTDMMASAGAFGHDVFLGGYQAASSALASVGTLTDIQGMYDEVTAAVNGDYTIGPNITDPRTLAVFTDLDAFVLDKTSQITTEFAALDAITGNADLDELASTWTQSNDALAREFTLLAQSDVDTTNVVAGHVGSMYSFASRLGEHGVDQYDAAAILERVADNSLGGETMKAALREGRNRALYEINEIAYAGAIEEVEEPKTEFSV